MLQATQMELDLKNPKVIWQVQISKRPNGKSGYQNKYSTVSATQAIMYYNAINIGRGYKKRLIKVEGDKGAIIARSTS